MMKAIELIENKLQFGVQQFSAQEVATLLNHIRVQKAVLDSYKEKGNK